MIDTLLIILQNSPKFNKLRYLSLYGNSLSTVEGIGVLKDAPLEELNLGDNLLQTLPEAFRMVRFLFLMRVQTASLLTLVTCLWM